MEHNKSQNVNRLKGRGRGRGKKKSNDSEKSQENIAANNDLCPEQESISLDLDADITQLEAPTFSTINKGPPEPMLRLNWNHKTHLIGEKVINPMIHCCDKCAAPILLYGRMIPCKHVFCFSCAEQENKICPRCQEKIIRIEKTGLGTVFMCTFGGTRYGSSGCRRTYLSQRDLQAHINHRHVSGLSQAKDFGSHIALSNKVLSPISRSKHTPHHTPITGDPRIQTSSSSNEYYHKMTLSPSSHSSSPSTPQSHPNSRSQSHLSQPQNLQSPHMLHPETHHQHIQSIQLPLQHNTQLQPQTPRHLSVSNQQIIQSADFVNPMIVPNYPPPTTLANSITPSSNVRSNLITVPIHDTNVDPSNTPVSIPLTSNFSHQYSTQFPQNSPVPVSYPVPPPVQPSLSQVPQSLPQYFANNPSTYTTPPPQRPAPFAPNSTQPMIGQPPIIATRGPPMVPPPRRAPFPNDIQPFSVPPPHRWHQPPPNQTHFY